MKPTVDMHQKAISIIKCVCVLVFCVLTGLNTYRMVVIEKHSYMYRNRMIVLENEVRELNEKFELLKSQRRPNIEAYVDYAPRKRRSFVYEGQNAENTEERNENLRELKRYPSLNSVSSNQNAPSTKRERDSKDIKFNGRSSFRNLDSFASSSESYIESSESKFVLEPDDEVSSQRFPRMQNLDERHPRTGRIKSLPSIHLSGDTSKYIHGRDENFEGNGHLRHLKNIFVDWKPNDWVEKAGMNNHFEYRDGYLTIDDSGLYFVYAQIYYLDKHDINAYSVFKNNDIILNCIVTSHTPHHLAQTKPYKGNTCYTAAVEYMKKGDQLSLGDVVQGHYSKFQPGKSFFGVVKLGDVQEYNSESFETKIVSVRRLSKTGRIRPLPSIHFNGDTAKYIEGKNENFKGNGQLKHINDIFVDWKPKDWVEKTGMNSHFEFKDGYLTINESGLYLIYTQIYYLDKHDTNGYSVYKNNDIILHCTVTSHTPQHLAHSKREKGNTCYTAGVEYMTRGDRISLGDIIQGHYSIFAPGKSFFGVVKLGDIHIRM